MNLRVCASNIYMCVFFWEHLCDCDDLTHSVSCVCEAVRARCVRVRVREVRGDPRMCFVSLCDADDIHLCAGCRVVCVYVCVGVACAHAH